MKAFATAIAVIALAFQGYAAPATSIISISEMNKRAITHFFVCVEKDFKGRCENLETPTGRCNNLGNGFKDTISSCGPDAGTACTVWTGTDCSGNSLRVVNPGIKNLEDFSGFNDNIASYKCE